MTGSCDLVDFPVFVAGRYFLTRLQCGRAVKPADSGPFIVGSTVEPLNNGHHWEPKFCPL